MTHARAVRRYRVLACVLAFLALGNVCSKPDWIASLEASVDRAVPALEAALDKLAADLPAAVAKLDAVAGRNLRELDATLRDAVDGLNFVLDRNRARLDAALAARVAQLRDIAESLALDVNAVARGLSRTISTNVGRLLVTTQQAAGGLLVTLGAQLANARAEGDRVVADVHSEADDAIARLAGIALLILGLLGGALVLVLRIGRRRAAALAIQLGAVVLVIAAGSSLALSSGCRRRFVAEDVVVIDHTGCGAALASATAYVGRYTPRVTPEAVAEASEILPAVASCLAMAGSSDLLALATARLADIRRLLGIAPPCLTSDACPTGQTCNPASGACRRTCTRSTDCEAGDVCHRTNTCSAPCTTLCPGGAACVAGICQSLGHGAGGGVLIGGGRGWSGLRACKADQACLKIGESAARDAIRRLQP